VQYISNYDGDTFRARLPIHAPSLFRVMNIRIRGIDAPEIKGQTQCERVAAIKVRDHARSLLRGARRIDLERIAHDKYFRLLATVKIWDDSGSYDLAKKLRELDPTDTADYDGKGAKAIWCSK
jgi:endonuclease YncB( thermonuclease family)